MLPLLSLAGIALTAVVPAERPHADLLGGEQIALLTPPSGIVGWFGAHVALAGHQVLVTGGIGIADDPGAVFVYEAEPGGYRLRQRIDSPCPQDPSFGADMEVAGELLYVSGTQDAYAYERVSGEWILRAKLGAAGALASHPGTPGRVLVGHRDIDLLHRTVGPLEQWTLTASLQHPFATGRVDRLCLGSRRFAAVVDEPMAGKVFVLVYDENQRTRSWEMTTQIEPLVPLLYPMGAELEGDVLAVGSVQATYLHARDFGGPDAWGAASFVTHDLAGEQALSVNGWALREGRLLLAGRTNQSSPNAGNALLVHRIEKDVSGRPLAVRTHRFDGWFETIPYGRGLDAQGSLVAVGGPVIDGGFVQLVRLEEPPPEASRSVEAGGRDVRRLSPRRYR